MTTPKQARHHALAHLVEHFGVKPDQMSGARVRSYDRALARLPVALLAPMVQRAIDTRTPRWGDLPTVAELRADAELCRQEIVKGLQFTVCAANENCTPNGFTEREINGVRRMVRCSCWTRHQAQIAALEVGSEPVALTAPVVGDWTGQDGD